MRIFLKEQRIKMGYKTQKEFATALNISERTLQNIEQGKCFPREQLVYKILKLLNTTDIKIFKNVNPNFKRGDATKTIRELMNIQSLKTFTIYDINAIRKAISLELEDRKINNIKITLNKEGKYKINKRITEYLKKDGFSNITAEDVALFRMCVRQEYTDRTGKSTWSIPEVRKKLGYDPVSGEMIDRDAANE